MTLPKDEFHRLLESIQNMDTEQLQQTSSIISLNYKAINAQQAREVASSIRLGDRVQLTNTRPQYLNGQQGEVVKLSESRADVKLDRGPQGKFRSGIVIAPLSTLIILD